MKNLNLFFAHNSFSVSAANAETNRRQNATRKYYELVKFTIRKMVSVALLARFENNDHILYSIRFRSYLGTPTVFEFLPIKTYKTYRSLK